MNFIGRKKSGKAIRIEKQKHLFAVLVEEKVVNEFEDYNRAVREGKILMLQSFFPEARLSEIKYLLDLPVDEWEQLILKFR